MMLILNRLQMRLFAAAMVFYVLVLTVQVDPFAHYMGAAAFFGLLAIPIRVVLVIVELGGLYFERRRDNAVSRLEI